MSPLVCPLDLHVYTIRELEDLRQARNPLVVTALQQGIDLLA